MTYNNDKLFEPINATLFRLTKRSNICKKAMDFNILLEIGVKMLVKV